MQDAVGGQLAGQQDRDLRARVVAECRADEFTHRVHLLVMAYRPVIMASGPREPWR